MSLNAVEIFQINFEVAKGTAAMSIGYWDVIENEAGDKFACQRTTLTGDEEYETTCWLDSEDAAHKLCDQLNDLVDDEKDQLP